MEIIVPAAGLSTRFPNMKPKYLLYDYKGDMMLMNALRPLRHKGYRLHIGILKEHQDKYNVIEQIPDCISNLSNLEKLDLRDNLISTFPVSFTQLKNLKWLDLKANDFTSLPNDFQNLNRQSYSTFYFLEI